MGMTPITFNTHIRKFKEQFLNIAKSTLLPIKIEAIIFASNEGHLFSCNTGEIIVSVTVRALDSRQGG